VAQEEAVVTPQRIQRKRTKGWRMPEGAVYVGRPSRWGNPYLVGEVDPQTWEERTAEDAVRLFRISVNRWWPKEYAEHIRAELADKDLACWCPLDQPCHADVLLEIANGGAS
jgi:hypothetical protein